MASRSGGDFFEFSEIENSAIECVLFEEYEEKEQETILIHCLSSAACQTESSYLDSWYTQPSIGSVPIFFCAFPYPGGAATQCNIPQTSDIGVGTDSSEFCHEAQTDSDKRPRDPPKASFLRNGFGKQNDDEKPFSTNDTKSLFVKGRGISPKRLTDTNDNSQNDGAKHHLTVCLSDHEANTGKKRGRKKSTCLSLGVANSRKNSSRTSVKEMPKWCGSRRRRKKKRDVNFEYDLFESSNEGDDGLSASDLNDSSDEWKPEDEDIEEDEKVDRDKASQLSWKEKVKNDDERVKEEIEEELKVSVDLPKLKNEGTDEDTNYKSLIDAVKWECDSSSEELNNWDERVEESEVFDDKSSIQGVDADSANQVMKVGISDLSQKANKKAMDQMKYITRAREKYKQEKIVKEDGCVVFKCLKCSKEFMMRMHLKEHRKVHARTKNNKIYKCSHCDKVFYNARKYYAHLSYHERLFECYTCGRRFSLLANMKKHIVIHENAPQEICEVCGLQFLTTELLQTHQETQHSDDHIPSGKIKCEHCSKEYVRKEAFNQHLSKAPYKCSKCEVSLGCEFQLKKHVRSEHGQCVCEFCGKSFKRNSLIHHIKIVHKEAKVKCPYCPKKFTYRSRMLSHIDANHNLSKKYQCNQCSYTARTVNTLNLHRRKYHLDAGNLKYYACNICSRKFLLPSKLTLHYRTHTGEKPFKCRTCNKGFASKYNMTEHERSVHGERVQLRQPDGSVIVRVVKHRRIPRGRGRRCDLCNIDQPSSSALLSHLNEVHGVQIITENVKIEHQEKELEDDKYPVDEVLTGSEDVILTASSGVLSICADDIPEYATHVEIEGVEYQVVRQ